MPHLIVHRRMNLMTSLNTQILATIGKLDNSKHKGPICYNAKNLPKKYFFDHQMANIHHIRKTLTPYNCYIII
jgi:hypothetical protein